MESWQCQHGIFRQQTVTHCVLLSYSRLTGFRLWVPVLLSLIYDQPSLAKSECQASLEKLQNWSLGITAGQSNGVLGGNCWKNIESNCYRASTDSLLSILHSDVMPFSAPAVERQTQQAQMKYSVLDY